MATSETKRKRKKEKGAAAGGSNDGDQKSGGPSAAENKKKQQQQPPEYNPRWQGYTAIALLSLVEFSAVSNVAANSSFEGHPSVALAWGVVTFAFAVAVLALDRSQFFADRFDYTKARDGNFEGGCLLFLVVFWICGVGFITQVQGVAYLTLNIYFATWFTLGACLYTLNEWSAAKDYLSFEELTSVSATLKSWWVLLLSSLVVTGTSINVLGLVSDPATNISHPDAALGVAAGAVSSIFSVLWISVHYRFFDFVKTGGWIELGCGALMVVFWIAGTAVITQDSGIGSTIVGTGCNFEATSRDTASKNWHVTNCSVVIHYQNETFVDSCADILDYTVPGSNLYVFTWISLATSLHLCFRWKAQKALKLAQSQEQQQQQEQQNALSDPTLGGSDDDEDSVDIDVVDDDVDLDDFEDAAY